MAKSSYMLFPLTLLLILLTSHSLPTNPKPKPGFPSTRRFTKIYAFGDSFTDTGNTHSTTGPYSFGYVSSPPYGTTFFHRSTNRYSDGRLVIDFLANTLSLPFLPPYLSRNSDFSHGANFAVAGSTAIEYEFYAKHNISIDIVPVSIMTELGWFDKFFKEKGGAPDMEKTLFWVGEIGANDYAYSVMSSTLLPDQMRGLAVNNVNNFLEGLLKRGAKYIIVQGLPLTGCLPLSLSLTPSSDRDALNCSLKVNKQSSAHNSLLLTRIQALRKAYPHSVISYADYSAAHRVVMQNPKRYGFTEPYKTCCGSGGGELNFDLFATCGSPAVSKACPDPARYVNWDGVHLTEGMYRIVSDLFFRHGYMRPSLGVLLGTADEGK
ncbi:hypothetical protein LUZ63_004410 [Rhynchospora breviuscula]|uniref:GDSL esterase/lipase n=1 Tax=Rhynchospora breviuscula TaxID=2022672 RepID=A0A9Q0D2I2_9POAL|nr:hypothetical protein LUZ63_004410 [Rhynchospora breviuscula]